MPSSSTNYFSEHISTKDMSISKKYIISILCVLSVGFSIGWLKIAYINLTYGNPVFLSALRGAALKSAIHTMIAAQPLSRVIQELKYAFPHEELWMHVGISHAVGEYAYQRYGIDAFSQCDRFFSGGCYHGVIDEIARTRGPDGVHFDELKVVCENGMKDPGFCTHPLGHAATIVSNYDVLKAFDICEILYKDVDYAKYCWNGAMMEYVNSFLPNIGSDTYGNPHDPYFPCNTFPSKYEASCVNMHVSYLNVLWDHDFPRLLAYCLTYHSGETVTQCTDAVGVIMGEMYLTTPSRVLQTCSVFLDNQSACMAGAVVSFVTAGKQDVAVDLCASLSDENGKTLCVERIQITAKLL